MFVQWFCYTDSTPSPIELSRGMNLGHLLHPQAWETALQLGSLHNITVAWQAGCSSSPRGQLQGQRRACVIRVGFHKLPLPLGPTRENPLGCPEFSRGTSQAKIRRRQELSSVTLLGKAQHFYFLFLLKPPGYERACAQV